MKRIASLGVTSLVLIGHFVSASYCRAQDDNENSAPAQWWMYSGQTASDVSNTISSQNARIVDIKVDNFSPYPFTVTYVQNTGSYAKKWWWYTGIDGPTLSANLSANNARLAAFKAYDTGGGQIRFTVAMISNTGADAKAWWFYPSLSATDIGNLTKTNNARLTSLQSYVNSNGQTLYAVIMIANTGADAKAWWWYPNASAQSIGNALSANKARPLVLTSAGNGNFNAVMESCASGCPAWWWYTNQAGSQVLSTAQQNGARVLKADTYPGCGGYCFAALMIGGSTGTQHGSVPVRLRGFVDLHTHPLSNLGFGGNLLFGGNDDQSLVAANAASCGAPVIGNSITDVLTNEQPVHGGINVLPGSGFNLNCGNAIREAAIHLTQTTNSAYDPSDDTYATAGYPLFPTWPIWNDITRQKMWVDWIRRSYTGGLRVMVALAVNNPMLANLAQSSSFPQDDKNSADLQIQQTIAFVNRHSDFMQIAYSSADIQTIVNANKLAVVLGVEVDNIGDWTVTGPQPTDAQVQAEIDRLYGEGVRYVFPIHLTDNAFGGTALYIDTIPLANIYEEGAYQQPTCSQPADDINYVFGFTLSGLAQYGVQQIANFNLFNSPPSNPSPCSTAKIPLTGHVNSRGLTPLGTVAIQEMIKMGMLIDVDHMSQLSTNATLALANAVPGGYPLNTGHNSLRCDPPAGCQGAALDACISNAFESGNCGGQTNERSLTAAQYARISTLHGMAGVGSAGEDAQAWIKNYHDVVQAMGGTAAAGFGTDTNGLATGMPPRPLSTVQYTSSFPMSSLGTQSWNYNNPVFGGVAHYGMLPDFLADVRTLPNGADLIDNNLMYGAQYFYETWQTAESRSAQLSAVGCPSNGNCCGRLDSHGQCAGTCVAENHSCSLATGYQCGSNQKCCGTADSHGNCSATCAASGGSCTLPGPTETEDDGTQMTFNGTAFHVCPTGMVMTGVDAGNNRFLCATGYTLTIPENPIVDTGTQSSFSYNSGTKFVHVCPPDMVMVGWQQQQNWLVCVLDEASGYVLGAGFGALHVDGPGGTQVPEPNNPSTNMHSCDTAGSGGWPYAMSGIEANDNVLICQNGTATPSTQ